MLSSIKTIYISADKIPHLHDLIEGEIKAMPADGPGLLKIRFIDHLPEIPLNEVLEQTITPWRAKYVARGEGFYGYELENQPDLVTVGEFWSKDIAEHWGERRDVGEMGRSQVPEPCEPKEGEGIRYGLSKGPSLLDKFDPVFKWSHLKCAIDATPMPGISTPFTYYGNRGAPFGWRLDDFDLSSVNYLVYGAPKMWYTVPMAQNGVLLQALKEASGAKCWTPYRHAERLVAQPDILKNRYDLDVVSTMQFPGEIIITHPLGMHAGYNYGPNMAESRSFCFPGWEDFARMTGDCDCEPVIEDNWKAGMKAFEKLGMGPT